MLDFLLQNEFPEKLLIQGHWVYLSQPNAISCGLCITVPFMPECLKMSRFMFQWTNFVFHRYQQASPPHNKESKINLLEQNPYLS